MLNPFAIDGWLKNKADFPGIRSDAVDALFEKGDGISVSEFINALATREGMLHFVQLHARLRYGTKRIKHWLRPNNFLLKGHLCLPIYSNS